MMKWQIHGNPLTLKLWPMVLQATAASGPVQTGQSIKVLTELVGRLSLSVGWKNGPAGVVGGGGGGEK